MKLHKVSFFTVAALALSLTACSAPGGSSPTSTEDKAAKFASDSLTGVSPAPAQSVDSAKWSGCSEETPGVHRFEYARSVRLQVSKADQQSIIDQVLASWKKSGYTVHAVDPGDPAIRDADAKDPGWTLSLRIVDDTGMFLIVNSGCVHVSSDPKT